MSSVMKETYTLLVREQIGKLFLVNNLVFLIKIKNCISLAHQFQFVTKYSIEIQFHLCVYTDKYHALTSSLWYMYMQYQTIRDYLSEERLMCSGISILWSTVQLVVEKKKPIYLIKPGKITMKYIGEVEKNCRTICIVWFCCPCSHT